MMALALEPKKSVLSSLGSLVRIGARELRSGLKGFQIFIACLALGVMVISAVGALGDALSAGFERQGKTILGGDMTFARMHTRATSDERQKLDVIGKLSETATMRTMARKLDGSDQALVELKGVDGSYPLTGDVMVSNGSGFREAMTAGGAVADSMLLERLGLKAGDRFRLGEAEVEIKSVLKSEPDGIADRLTYGPRVFVSLETLDKTKLVQPGSLVRWRYAVDQGANGPQGKDALKKVRQDVLSALPQSGFSALDRYDPSPQVTRTLERLRQFLVLIGLASLLIGGVGIANAVSTFIEKRTKTVATMRSVGATGAQILTIFLVQILAMSAIGIAIGLALGVTVPSIVEWLVGDAMPVKADFRVSPRSVLMASAYGFLVAILFALWPLGRAEHVRATVLFRDSVQTSWPWPRWPIIIATTLLVMLLLGLALLTSNPKSIAMYAFGALAAMLAIFTGLGYAVTWAARRFASSSRPAVSLAIRNVGAPDGLTRSVILSLGTGLSLLVAVGLVNDSLIYELKGRLPENSPDYFLLDVPKKDYQALASDVTSRVPGVILTDAPMLRGRLVKLKGKPVEEVQAPPEAQWVLNGDRGLSYSNTVPEGSKVTAGDWWQPGYTGEPLVSFESDLAEKLKLAIGDKVTVNILGRNVEAKIANLREVKWENLAINFVMVFSPNTFEKAQHNLLATVRLPPGTPTGDEVALVRDLGKKFPAISAIRVRDAINQFNKIFDKVMTAVQVAGGVTLVAGGLVLAGALATAQRRRILEAVILKTIGARRAQILAAHAVEYALLTLAAALVAILLGTAAAWVALEFLLDETPFTFSLSAVLRTLALAGGLITLFGGIGTWAVLKAPPVPVLRGQ